MRTSFRVGRRRTLVALYGAALFIAPGAASAAPCTYDPASRSMCYGPGAGLPQIDEATTVEQSKATYDARITRARNFLLAATVEVARVPAKNEHVGGAIGTCTAASCQTGPAGASNFLPEGLEYIDDISALMLRAATKLKMGQSIIGSEDERLILSPALRYFSELPGEGDKFIPGGFSSTTYSTFGWDFTSGAIVRLAMTANADTTKISPAVYAKILTLLTFDGTIDDQSDARRKAGAHPIKIQMDFRDIKVPIPEYKIKIGSLKLGSVGGTTVTINTGTKVDLVTANTENHTLMSEVARYIGNKLKHEAIMANNRVVIDALARAGMSTDLAYYDNSNTEGSGGLTNDQWMVEHLQDFMKYHFYEYQSRPYQIYTLGALHLLHDAFDADESTHPVKIAVKNVLDMQAAIGAVNSMKLRTYVPFRRHNYFIDTGVSKFGTALGWLSSPGHYDTDRLSVVLGNFNHLVQGQIAGISDNTAVDGVFPCSFASTAACTPSKYRRNTPYQQSMGASSKKAIEIVALTDYRLPDVALDLHFNKDQNYYQRLRTGNPSANGAGDNAANQAEVYASSKSYLISSGGHFDPDHGLAQNNLRMTAKIHIKSLMNTLCPTIKLGRLSYKPGEDYTCPIPEYIVIKDTGLRDIKLPARPGDTSFSTNVWDFAVDKLHEAQDGQEDMHGMPLFTVIDPSDSNSEDINDKFRIEGHKDYHKRNNSCVAPDFACGLAPKMPLNLTSADLTACGETVSGDWKFYNFADAACPQQHRYGFYLAKYEKACAASDKSCTEGSSTGNFGLMEFYDAKAKPTPMTFAAFKDAVKARNPGAFTPSGTQTYTTQAGNTISFVIDTQWNGHGELDCVPFGDIPNCKYKRGPTSQILSITNPAINSGRPTVIPANYNAWPLATGTAINASNGRWVIQSGGKTLTLDSSTAIPSRTE